MTGASTPAGELVRPLADLAAWTSHFRRAEIPVLRETVDALDALRANEERTDANSIGEMIGGDPLMTLKVLAYVSDHRGRSVVTAPGDRHRGAGDDGHPAVLPRLRCTDIRRGPSRGVARGAWPACSASCGERIAVRASRSPWRCIAPTRTRPPSTLPPCCTNSPRCCSGATRRSWRCASARCRTPTRRCARASLNERCFGIELDELQQALVAAWRLPSLLAETAQEPQAGQTGARAVALGSRLARHTAAGWENAAIPDDVAEVAALLNLSPAAALELLMEIDAE